MLLHKEEDGKAEDGDKEHECVPTIISIFRSIKQSEDVTDATKSKVSKTFPWACSVWKTAMSWLFLITCPVMVPWTWHSHNLYKQSSHAICELGLSIIKHLTQKELDLQGEFMPVSLPPTLYKPSENNEGDKSQVTTENLSLVQIFNFMMSLLQVICGDLNCLVSFLIYLLCLTSYFVLVYVC